MLFRLLTVGAYFRIPTFLALLAITIGLAAGLQNLKVDTSFNKLFSENDPTRTTYEAIKKEFGSDNTTIVFIRDNNLWDVDKLTALEDLHYKLENLGFVEKVESLYNIRSIRDQNGNIDSSSVIADIPRNQADLDKARENALFSPVVVGNFISQDGFTTAVNVSVFKADPNDQEFDSRAYAAMEELIAPLRGNVFDEIFQVGPPRVNAELKNSLFSDMSVLFPGAIGILIATIFVFIRSPSAIYIPVLPGVLSLIWTFGMMGWLGIPINILSAMLPSLVLVIGATEDTHMLATYLTGVGEADKSLRKDDVRRWSTDFMARHIGLPIILTTLTTTLGFASNMFSDIGLIREFAYASSFAIAANGVITLLFVPMLVRTFGPTKTSLVSENAEPTGIIGKIVGVFNYLSTVHPIKCAVSIVLITLVFFWQSLNIHVSNDPLSYFKQEHPLVAQTEKVHEDLSGMEIFYITLDSKEPEAFKNPKNLQMLADIKTFIQQQGAFDNVISLADHLSLVNREWNRGKPEYFRIPGTVDLVNQYLLFFQRSDISAYISADFQRANMIVRHNIHDSHILKEYLEELEWEVDGIVDADISFHMVGQNLMVNRAAEFLLRAQLEGMAMLLVVIFIMMSLMYVSIRGGIISLVPNLVPIILTFGTMGIFGIPVNPGTATVAVIAIGIAIDDTIHLLARYSEESRRTPDRHEAVRKTVNHEAIPVISTSVSLMAGFMLLLLSDFSIIAQFGALSALTMLFAVVADLLITPLLIRNVRLVGLYEILGLNVGKEVLHGSPLFAGMSSYQIRKAILLSGMREFKAGDLLVEQGTTGQDMYLVLNGKVDVLVRTDDGTRIKVSEMSEGNFFGEVGFVSETKRTADIEATSDGKLLIFNADQLQQIMDQYPRIASRLVLNISRVLGGRLADSLTKLEQK